MRILVTGGAGLIGSHLCESLVKSGNEVICLDNFQIGRLENIKHLKNFSNFHVKKFDITNKLKIDADLIYNLASPTAPGHFMLDPIATFRSNIDGTINVLDLAKSQKIPVIHISSIRALENSNTFNNGACYIESKRGSETICYEYKKEGLDVKVIRLFNVYGEGMRTDDSRVIPQFVIKGLKNETLDVLGGLQRDSFCYVKDIVKALITISNIDLETPVNIGSKNFVTILQLAKLIISVINSKSNLNIIQSNGYQDRSNIPIDSINGWEPEVDLEEGIKFMGQYFLEQIIN
jgi:UDP-glucuronate decarboxylase